MQKIIYSCDKCKKKVETEEDLLNVRIEVRHKAWQPVISNKSFDLCLACREKAGLTKRVITETKTVEEPATTKDKLYGVVCDLIAETGIRIEH